jgi:hypothetical protein
MDTQQWVTDFFRRMQPKMSPIDSAVCQTLVDTDTNFGVVLSTSLHTAENTNSLTTEDAQIAVNILLNEPTSDYHRFVPAWQDLINEVTTKQAA